MGRLGGLGLVGQVGRVGLVGAVNKNEIIWLAPVVVNDNCEIISFALGMCKERRVLAC
ncbi:hypothetical protein [Capnocytophaga leadbetteri]|uniref:hypothetical protein n=1 Tax=Capnocytophaga leadbetteri TaxID=327575 RepID=UPI0028E3D5FF|nr:hypothetical protein [Capnocytophaga leadbetteri]